MDLEFKSAADKWDFMAEMHKKLRGSYESENEFVELNKTEQFRLVRVLEQIHYPLKEKQ